MHVFCIQLNAEAPVLAIACWKHHRAHALVFGVGLDFM